MSNTVARTSSTAAGKRAKMSSSAGGGVLTKRLKKELQTLMFSKDKSVSAFPKGTDFLNWTGNITGANGTVYEGLSYKLSLSFPSDYPCSAPTVKFETPCFHPNVDQHGNICLDILKDQWSAVYDVSAVLRSIQSLLGEPNNDSPLNGHAATLWDDQVEYKRHLTNHYKQHTSK